MATIVPKDDPSTGTAANKPQASTRPEHITADDPRHPTYQEPASNPGFDDDRPIADQIGPIPTSDQEVPIISPGSSVPEGEPHTGVTDAQDQVTAKTIADDNEMAAAIANQENADDVHDTTRDRVTDAEDTANALMSDNERRQQIIQERIDKALEGIDEIPAKISAEFDRISSDYDRDVSQSLGRMDAKAEAAAANAMQHRADAMQAAVQGIQGNVNTAIAQINANPNLTQAQKASMIASTRLKGASALAPAIGATVVEFAKIDAEIATAFGGFSANIETMALSKKGDLAGAEGAAFAESTVAVKEITNMLLSTSAQADASYNASQSQLLATRTHAQMTGSQIEASLLPERYAPWYDPTGLATLTSDLNKEIMNEDWRKATESIAMAINFRMLQEQEGNPGRNGMEVFLSTLADTGNWFKAVMAGAGSLAMDAMTPENERPGDTYM